MTKKILYVDDDKDTSDAVCFLLLKHGFDVDKAHSAEKSIRMANKVSYDVVISDIILPDMSGVEIARSLETPVILVGNYPKTESEILAFARDGVRGYLNKPFTIKDLISHVNSLF